LPGPNLRHEDALNAGLVLDVVRTILADVIGEDYVSLIEIGPETSFQADLEIESIELVAMGEQLQERYAHVDFAGWLSTMEVDEIIAMTVGDLVDHITTTAQEQASKETEVHGG
jgi:acyl carrier protein